MTGISTRSIIILIQFHI